MDRMAQDRPVVVGGVDAHADAHHAAVLDARGGLLATASFATTRRGYAQLLEWVESFGVVEAIAVESTGSYAAGLARYLRGQLVAVVEVNQPHAHTRRRRGKSDPVDAEMAARCYQAGQASAQPKQTTGIVESIRMLRVARGGAVKARSAALVQLRDLIITAPDALREQLTQQAKTLRGQAALCARLRPDTRQLACPLQAAKFALRSLARRIAELDAAIAALDRQLKPLVATAAPHTSQHLGISTGHAGQLLVTAGQNIQRLANGESAYAALCGASPLPASSGKTTRHRLNRGGDRQANRALYLIVVCRMRCCPRTRAYVQRRTQEGKTTLEIIRCLKRYVAREVYTSLRHDLAQLPPPQQQASPATAILCGSPGSGTTKIRS